MLDPRAGLGNARIAPLLGLRYWLFLAAFALDLQAPALPGQPILALAIYVALVCRTSRLVFDGSSTASK